MEVSSSRSENMEFNDTMTQTRKLRKRDVDNVDDDNAIAKQDYISSLPDTVLSDILSLLPTTKEAVATSVLSKRWRRVYTWITRLHFDDSSIPDCARGPNLAFSFPKFKKFVDDVLETCHSGDITTFKLHIEKPKFYGVNQYNFWHCYPDILPVHFNTWLSYPLTHRVKELDIHAHLRQLGKLPTAIFRCPSLEVLKLNLNIYLDFPLYTSFCLPNLKECHLTVIEFPANGFLTRLVTKCPSLEHLYLSGSLSPVVPVEFCSTTLRRLSIIFTFSYGSPRCKTILNVPNLEYFTYHDVVAMNYDIRELNALVEAEVQTNYCFTYNGIENVLDFISTLSNVQCLNLMRSCVKALGVLDIEHKIPVFRNLKHLKLGNTSCIHWNKVLIELLSCTPLLETLAFEKGIDDLGEKNSLNYQKLFEEECQLWSTTETVSSCLRFHLKRIVILYSLGTDWELEIIKYFLKNALVLEELVVSGLTSASLADRISVERTLQKLSRGSATCSVKVDWMTVSK